MSDPVVIFSSCDRLFGVDTFGIAPTSVVTGGVYENAFQFGQFGGLSGGFHFGLPVFLSQAYTGCHVKYTGRTSTGGSIITHGNVPVTIGFGTGPRQFSMCGFSDLGKPYTAIGGPTSNLKFDESGWTAHANTWHYVELRTSVSGELDPEDPNFWLVYARNEMFVDGRVAVATSSENAYVGRIPITDGSFSIGRVQIGGVGSSTMVDNIYAGSIRYGGMRVQRYLPTADGSHTDWTPSSSPPGDLYVEIDESGATNYSDYIFTDNVGDKASFTFGPLDSAITEILGVDWNIISGGLEDSSPTEVRNITGFVTAGSPATQYDGDAWFFSAPQGLDGHWSWLTNPVTAANFTVAELEAAEFGLELTS